MSHGECVATILVVERDDQVRELLLLQLGHLGHAALDGGRWGELPAAGGDYDAIVLEPVSPDARLFAGLMRRALPELPLLFVSIEGPDSETRALDPVVHLVKPVLLADLRNALDAVWGSTGA